MLCPDGRPFARSYYLYGPEGVRELDPDERLLMAMSSDSKPLTSMLQQLSNRRQFQETQGSFLQAIGKEHGRIAGSFADMAEVRTLLARETSENQRPNAIKDLLDTILEKFKSPKKLGKLEEISEQDKIPEVGDIVPKIESILPEQPELSGVGQ